MLPLPFSITKSLISVLLFIVTFVELVAFAFTFAILELSIFTVALVPFMPSSVISCALVKSSTEALVLIFSTSTPVISTCWFPFIASMKFTVSLPAPPSIGMILPLAPVTLNTSSCPLPFML